MFSEGELCAGEREQRQSRLEGLQKDGGEYEENEETIRMKCRI